MACIVSCPAKGAQNQMKLIPQTKRNEGKSKAGQDGVSFAKKAQTWYEIICQRRMPFSTTFRTFHFVFILAGDLSVFECPQKLVENGKRAENLWRVSGKASLGFHFALLLVCQRPREEDTEVEVGGAAQTCNDIHRRKRWNFLIACKCFISLIFRKENPRMPHYQEWYVWILWARDVKQDKENTKVKWDWEQESNSHMRLSSLKVIGCSDEY